MEYPWYCKISNSEEILQGDFVNNCPLIIPPNNFEDLQNGDYEPTVRELNTIILSQSCDLEQGKIEIVLVCPYYTLEYFLKTHPTSRDGSTKGRKKAMEGLRDASYPPYHLMNSDKNVSLNECLVVDFKSVYAVDFNFLKQHQKRQKNRIRLMPPYREHLSQAFARYFMRVGLPQSYNLEI